MKISTQSYLTLAVLMPVILLIHPYIAAKETSNSKSNNNLLTEDHFHLGADFETEFSSMENQIASTVTTINSTITANDTGLTTDTISQDVEEEDGDENPVSFITESVGTTAVVGRNYDGGYHHPSPVHIDFSPIFLAIVPIALFLGAAAAFALATASSSSSSAAAAAQQQQQQQEASNNNNNANNNSNNNNNAILVALIAALINNHKGHAKAHKTIIYAYNVTKSHDHDWRRRSMGDDLQFSLPQKVKPLMSHFHRSRKYVKEEP